MGEGTCAGELLNHGVVGVVIMGKIGMEFVGVVEDLEGEVEILLAVDHGDEALRGEAGGPWFYRRRDAVGFKEVCFGLHGGE